MRKTAQNYVNSEQIKTFHDGSSRHQPLTFISAMADCYFWLAVCVYEDCRIERKVKMNGAFRSLVMFI